MHTKQNPTRQGKAQPKASRTTQFPGTSEVSSRPSSSVCDDPQARIAARAHELYVERGCGDGYALDDWIRAEREVISQIPPV